MALDGQSLPVYPWAMNAKTLTLTDVAQYLGYGRRTLYNMLNDGRFPVKPIPGTQPRRWNIDDLDAWRAGTYQPREAS
jgi:excisionase family DNA binding protein